MTGRRRHISPFAVALMVATVTIVSHVVHVACSRAAAADDDDSRRAFLLVGPPGSGKSTLANCIRNRQGEIRFVDGRPFIDSSNVSKPFSIAMNNNTTVVDMAGFESSSVDDLSQLEDHIDIVLWLLETRLDAVLFVVSASNRSAPLDRKTLENFQLVRRLLLEKNNVINRFLLIVTRADEPGWVERHRQSNVYLAKTLDMCNDYYFEFGLRVPPKNDSRSRDAFESILDRQQSIDELLHFLRIHTSKWPLFGSAWAHFLDWGK